jgi:murein DD-endopeptidase MepM/ murein hydrolase activator NlpD
MKKILSRILFFVLIPALFAGLVFLGKSFIRPHKKVTVTETPVIERMFGIPVDSFKIEEGVIRPDQNLGEVLTGFGVSMAKVDQLVKASEGVFDLKKIKTGQNFYIFQSPDTSRSARYLVYEKNRIDYVVFNLADSLSISIGKKRVRVEQKTASGVINSNLWNTIEENKLSPALALDLSDIYAWSVDFFGIQRGDRFRVLYEEQFVDSLSVGIGPIHAAEFEHMGKSYYAFRFFQDKGFDYFDDSGENLRKAFLKAPLSFSRISSRFTGSRFHPILKIRRPHFGVDYSAARGTPVMSIGEGTVIEKSFQGGGAGNYIKIRHNTVYETTYMHLSGFASGISAGAHVRQGEVIGYVGSTGLSTGPHLDFRVYKNGSPMDPLQLEAPPGEPVRTELKSDYQTMKDSLLMRLYSIHWGK